MVPESEDEKISRDILLGERPDIVSQVADGKNLRKALSLTCQLAEYEIPLILDINMMDEVGRMGISIDARKLSSLLGVPVTETIATEGQGVAAFCKAFAGAAVPRVSVFYPCRVESAIAIIGKLLRGSGMPLWAVCVTLLVCDEDVYLPRLSVLVDRVLRKIALNGKGVIPLSISFSCITMAILPTRVLDARHERFIATCLLVLGIPCAPVLAVMLVLLKGMSIWASVLVFGVIAVQITVAGLILGRLMPGRASDFILKLPPIRIPRFRSLTKKTWWRVWWFTKEAAPLFLLATFVLFLLEMPGLLTLLEKAAKPVLTTFLGLPPESVQVAIMKIIRKESTGAHLSQLTEAGMFDNVQVVVCLLLLTFLFPCLNSILVMIRERGMLGTISIVACVSSYALVLAATVNWLCRALGVTFG
jgi:Fe2+ transport system protein B